VGYEVFLHPPNHLLDRGRIRLVIAYIRDSIRTTLLPDLFSKTAAVRPVMPPPMIATSAEMSPGIAG